MYAPIDALRFETLLKALEVLKNVEIEIKARRSERRSTHASAAAGSSSPSTEAGASKASGASSQPGQPAGSSRNPKTGTPMSGFRLDLKAKKVQGAETALEDSDQDDQDADEIDLNSARMQPTSVMELFHELEQQVEAEKAADEQASLESDGNETAQEALEEGAREPLPVSKKSVKAISSRPGEHLGGSVELKKVKVESPGRKRWASTLHKVRGMNLAKEHLAGLFDQSLPNCTPVELLRSFGGLHYVTCKQVKQQPKHISAVISCTILLVCVLYPDVAAM